MPRPHDVLAVDEPQDTERRCHDVQLCSACNEGWGGVQRHVGQAALRSVRVFAQERFQLRAMRRGDDDLAERTVM